MKKTVSTFVLAGLMTAGFSGMAMAGTSEGTQGLDPSVEATLKTTEDHNKQLDDLAREKEILDLESSVSKLRFEKEKTEADRRKLVGAPITSAAAVAPSPADNMPPVVPMGMPDMNAYFGAPQQAQPAAKKKAPVSPLDRVYVTRIYGVGGVKNVTVFFDNGVFTGTVGDEIVEGLRISKVTDNGAVFVYKGKSKSVNLTTQGIAYSKSQVKHQSDDSDEESSAARLGQGFGKMAQEITTGVNIPPPHPR
jgi:hypothetical protein